MPDRINQVFLTWEEAQKLRPIFHRLKVAAPWKDARESAMRIAQELDLVRRMDYSPLPGKQLVLSDTDYEFLTDVMSQVNL